VSAKRSQENFVFLGRLFLSFFCDRKGQAYLKTLEVRLLLRFLNVLDQSCEMSKNCFDVIQICQVIIV
jgi:site-specific recombinase